MKAATALALAFFVAAPLAAEQSFTGQISDSLCKAKHEEAAEDQGKMSDHDCTVACVKGGSKYVLLGADGKVYDIANQDFKDLEKNAGAKVKITGDLKGTAISVSKIDPQ
ncbi:MAG TPA: hypothetical protein VFB07_03865 [Vicinamibacterales bacterium]|nr:hypothetical protein [Vicinamibacterales bacterium]